MLNTTGRPRKYETNAARQKAYNQRKKMIAERERLIAEREKKYEHEMTADTNKRLARFVASEFLGDVVRYKAVLHPSLAANDEDENTLRKNLMILIEDLRRGADTLR